jgi:cobalt-precorrin 5A hydrolase
MRSRIIAGIGCRRDCPAEAITALVGRAGAEASCSVTALAAPAFKANEPGLREASHLLGLALILVEPAALAAAQMRCVTRSDRVARATGFASVAEGSALAAAGPTGRLILPRVTKGGASCALAEARS